MVLSVKAMKAPSVLVVAVVMMCQGIHSMDPADEVTMLPGLTEPINFRHFSGFLRAGGTRKLHYWFVESQRSPKDDPLLVWLNGGPGCSSMIGLLSELGPFRVTRDKSQLRLNPHAWNKVANVLFLESPAGVGFSYDPSSPYNYTSDDETTADDNYVALWDFFRKYPEFIPNDFYVTGESYGGVYVPMLTQRVLNRSNIKLKGYAVGNGVSDIALLRNSLMFFGYYHGLWGLRLWTRLTQHCCNGSVSESACDFVGSGNHECSDAYGEAVRIIREGLLNPYNLYGRCQNEPSRRVVDTKTSYNYHLWNMVGKILGKANVASDARVGHHLNCSYQDDMDVAEYLNQPEVKAAIHVENSPLNWTSCSDVLNYTQQYDTMKPIVKELADSGRLRALLYNGDADMVCNFLGNEWFVNSLGYKPTSSYKNWMLHDQVAGFYETYEGNITFATVKGSGHMVPENKPAQALKMITNFLKNTPL